METQLSKTKQGSTNRQPRPANIRVKRALWLCALGLALELFEASSVANAGTPSPSQKKVQSASSQYANSSSTKILRAGAAAAAKGDFLKTVALWHPLAEDGNASAQFGLGLIYRQGGGTMVERDQERAHQLFTKAGAQGHVRALFQLGVGYERGLGTKKDTQKALFFYQLAAAAHNIAAQFNLAILLGKATPNTEKSKQNIGQAYQWALIAQRQAKQKPTTPALSSRINNIVMILAPQTSFAQRQKAQRAARILLGQQL